LKNVAAVHHKRLARDVGGIARSQEAHRRSNFVGVPGRPTGVCIPATRSDSEEEAVAIHPGATALMVIPALAVSIATARIIPSIAAFAAP